MDFECKVIARDDGQPTPIELDIDGDIRTVVERRSRIVFGKLEQSAQRMMTVFQRELETQIFADTIAIPAIDTAPQNHTRAKTSKAGARLGLYVILYGRPCDCRAVGEFTARCNLFLQHPRGCHLNVPYQNPHCLSPESIETVYTHGIEYSSVTESAAVAREFQNPIDLFADSEDQKALEAALSPEALRTELYPHQKQALTFMLQRELGWALDGPQKDIWKTAIEPSGRVLYVNTVSGQKQLRPPSNFRGGLLIDAPGLGKSLSIISLILSTKERNMMLPRGEASKSTTLLVVPKTCKSTHGLPPSSRLT